MKNVALIFGGPSGEHDVSLVSAKNIYEVIKDSEFKIHLIGVTRQGQWKMVSEELLLSTSFENVIDLETCEQNIQLKNNGEQALIDPLDIPLDVAFPIIHGPYGENGELQRELNKIGLSFVGSDEASCETCFDKEKSKKSVAEISIPQVDYLSFEEKGPHFNEVDSRLGTPFFVKPANMGSSVGISKVNNEAEYVSALDEALKYDKKIVIEKGVTAREIECAILEKNGEISVSSFGEIVPNHDFYSYEAKYLDPNGAQLIVPAKIDEKMALEITNLAKQCFKKMNCRDYVRADFFLTPDNKIYFNEINTHPGFTSISMFPLLWKHSGLEYKDLIIHLLKMALNRN